MTDQGANMDAIDKYILSTPRRTAEATAIRDKWLIEYPKVSWFDKNYSQAHYDWARNFRNAFNRANAVTEEQKAAAVHQATTGVTTEDIKGEPDRRTSTGDYVLPPKEKNEPFFPTRVKVAAGIALAGAVVLGVLKKLYLDPFLPRR